MATRIAAPVHDDPVGMRPAGTGNAMENADRLGDPGGRVERSTRLAGALLLVAGVPILAGCTRRQQRPCNPAACFDRVPVGSHPQPGTQQPGTQPARHSGAAARLAQRNGFAGHLAPRRAQRTATHSDAAERTTGGCHEPETKGPLTSGSGKGPTISALSSWPAVAGSQVVDPPIDHEEQRTLGRD